MNWLDAEIAARVGEETKDWEEREVAAFLRKQAERQEHPHRRKGEEPLHGCLSGPGSTSRARVSSASARRRQRRAKARLETASQARAAALTP